MTVYCASVYAQSTGAQGTNIAIQTGAIQSSIRRLGINLGTLNNYDSGQISQNLITGNPGFEGQIWNSTIRCAYGTATSCTDENQYGGWPAGFWNGATYQIFYGAAAGRTGTIANSTATGYGEGVILNFGDSGAAPAQGDYLIVRKTVPGGSTAGWAPYTSGAGSITDNLTDLPPGTSGKQTTVLTAPTQNDFANLSFFFDGTSGKTFLQMNGTYHLQFKAKGIGGSNQVYVQLTRYGVSTYLNQVTNLTNSWNTYDLTFTTGENGSAIGTVGLAFSTIGASAFELDDVSLTLTSGDSTNTTAFRDPVVSALRTLQPGTLRYWGNNGQLGESLDNLLAPQFGRQLAGYSPYFGTHQIDYGLHEFLALAQLVGADPWFVVPATFTKTDASNLIEYLAGTSSTPYGAKRAALGQATPWTQVFGKIHLEFGNEAWNGTFKGGNIEYSAPYGGRAQTIFAAMRANAAYVAGSFDLVLGGQAYAPSRNTDIQNYCNNNDSFAIAPYTMNQVDSFADNESLFGSTFAEPEALTSSNGTAEGHTPGAIYQNYEAIQSSSHPVPLSFYEINMSTLSGAITQAALNTYTPSLGAGLMVADTMLQSMATFGVVNQELFALPQYNFNASGGNSVLLWGSVIDMGVTNRRRPQYLAVQLANQALSNGATMLATVQSGANPTWNQPLVNSVQLSGAHYVQSYAFSQGQNMSTVLFNFSRSSPLPVTFSGNAPGGTVQMQQLTSGNLTDTNESSNVVTITPSTLGQFNPTTGLTLPPYSMTVLTWTQQAPLAPVISGIGSGSLTGTSATVSWTTDQPASSLVNYGTTTSYGSASTPNSALSTSHSVALTSLTPGTTYNFDVVSVNSSGTSSTSANSTFVTIAQAPVISAVKATLTGTSATITWTTDQASSSLVNYGTATTYGSASTLNTTLSTSHSVTLTGLTAGVTYNYDAVSANSGGVSSTSANATFVTTTQAPVISAVKATSTGTSATITWTTDQGSSSLVNFGTTTTYGSASTLNSTLSSSHSVTLTGLALGMTYNFDVVSANSGGGSSTSANMTFATTAPAPVISAITAGNVTGTTATITWTTDQGSTSLVNYGTTTAYGTASPINATLSTSHSVTLGGLTPGVTYDFDVVSTNSANNSTTSANGSFITGSQAPAISAVTAGGVTGTSATITWTTDQASSSLVNYGTTTGYGSASATNSTLATTHSISLTGLTAGVTYNFDVVSANSAGNSTTSANGTFATIAQAPVISAVSTGTITNTSATITWTTDQAASSLVNYGTTTNYGSASALNSTLSTSHSVTLTGLVAGATYDFAAVSASSAGNSASSSNGTFATSATTGTSAPPTLLYVADWSITSSGVTIGWSTEVNSSTQVAYGVTPSLGQSSPLQSTPTNSHGVVLTGLNPGTTYYFVAQSADANGNTGVSSTYSFTTISTVGPVVSNVVVTPGPNNTAQIAWTTSVAAASYVTLGPTTSYGRWSSTTALTTSPSPNLGYVPSGVVHYQLYSSDQFGNQTISQDNTFVEP